MTDHSPDVYRALLARLDKEGPAALKAELTRFKVREEILPMATPRNLGWVVWDTATDRFLAAFKDRATAEAHASALETLWGTEKPAED